MESFSNEYDQYRFASTGSALSSHSKEESSPLSSDTSQTIVELQNSLRQATILAETLLENQKRDEELKSKLEQEIAKTKREKEEERQRIIGPQEGMLQLTQAYTTLLSFGIDECINQYILLGNMKLNFGDLNQILSNIERSYVIICTVANDYYAKLKAHRHGKFELSRIPWIRQRYSEFLNNPCSQHLIVNERYTKPFDRSQIQKDILKSMELYKELSGILYPFWTEEQERYAIEQEAVALKKEEGKKQKVNDLKEMRPSKEREILAIREAKLDEYIVGYKLLGAVQTLEELKKVLGIINVLYTGRIEELKRIGINEKYSQEARITEVTSRVLEWLGWNRHISKDSIDSPDSERLSEWYSVRGLVKDDVLASMELHKKIYGNPHPFWHEFYYYAT